MPFQPFLFYLKQQNRREVSWQEKRVGLKKEELCSAPE